MTSSIQNSSKKFYPVIHASHEGAYLVDQVAIARMNGADGVFLIDQGTTAEDICTRHIPDILGLLPGTWIGVNFLKCRTYWNVLNTLARYRLDHVVKAVWIDDCGVDSLDKKRLGEAAAHYDLAGITYGAKRPALFGGTAFKTQRALSPGEATEAALRAAEVCDVVTTSGRGTGVQATLEHVQAVASGVKKVEGDVHVGLASGVTPENAHLYLPYVDHFLVATGIESSFGQLDPAKTRACAEAIHRM